jgi:type I restriction enzyme R subunit
VSPGIAKILPATNPFLPESGEKKQIVIARLKEYFNRFYGMVEDINYIVPKSTKKSTRIAQQVQLIPQGSMLTEILPDTDENRLINNMMALDQGTTILAI